MLFTSLASPLELEYLAIVRYLSLINQSEISIGIFMIQSKLGWSYYSSSGPIRGEYCDQLTNHCSPGEDVGDGGSAEVRGRDVQLLQGHGLFGEGESDQLFILWGAIVTTDVATRHII